MSTSPTPVSSNERTRDDLAKVVISLIQSREYDQAILMIKDNANVLSNHRDFLPQFFDPQSWKFRGTFVDDAMYVARFTAFNEALQALGKLSRFQGFGIESFGPVLREVMPDIPCLKNLNLVF